MIRISSETVPFTCNHVGLRGTYARCIRLARAAVSDRLEIHHGRLAVVMCVLMTVAVIVTVGFTVFVPVAMRVIVPMVFYQKRQCVSSSGVMVQSIGGSDHVQMPR